ncbi:SNARE associated Golgi protein-related protein [Thermaerobacter marianensis DSM 12885]|uniref:SNARE associated Golgi protein-related protein n=1 Tax=Thermaerobacter marianensis (strain ATCC 700841 / DSM 12885 / JCM 10246 / 7p75a) TaxID=644966 RepID=E6SG53_THEM7|nr:DedA family protein [Thermaerobacter marianensis]ADU50470.1 SNARE associated Golgi protein-related protein [Thermaerobacter marianensis DSM 12885]
MDWLTQVVERWGYLGLVAVVALENLFPPIPSEVVIPFAGFLTTFGMLTLPGVIAASTLGSLLGALVLYGAGRALGRHRLEALTRRYGHYLGIQIEHVERAEAWFARYGAWAVLVGRLVPIVRSLISIPAGLAGMPGLMFAVYTVAGTLVWNTALAGAGTALGAAWPLVQEWVRLYQRVLLMAALVLVAVWVGLRLAARPRK